MLLERPLAAQKEGMWAGRQRPKAIWPPRRGALHAAKRPQRDRMPAAAQSPGDCSQLGLAFFPSRRGNYRHKRHVTQAVAVGMLLVLWDLQRTRGVWAARWCGNGAAYKLIDVRRAAKMPRSKRRTGGSKLCRRGSTGGQNCCRHGLSGGSQRRRWAMHSEWQEDWVLTNKNPVPLSCGLGARAVRLRRTCEW